MRVPLRSERDAFRLALGVLLVTGLAVLVGVLTAAVGGIVVAAVCLVAGLGVLFARRSEPEPILAEAEAEPHPAAVPGRRELLVIANAALAGESVEREVGTAGAADVEMEIVAPVVTSAIKHVTSDVDSARAEATRRLETSLVWARNHGFAARGRVGDEDTIATLADELRLVGADRVVVVTGPAEAMTRDEEQELDRLRTELDIPVTHATVQLTP